MMLFTSDHSKIDSTYVTPLNIAVKDTDETVADTIVQHDLSDTQDKK